MLALVQKTNTTAVTLARAYSTKTAAATTALITILTMSFSVVTEALFITAAVLLHVMKTATAFIRKAACVQVC